MTPADIATLRGLCERATPGPWRQGSVETYNVFAPSRPDSEQLGHEWVVLRMNTHFPSYIADAAFVAAARQAVPALIDRVEELERERDAARRERDAFSYDTLTRERNQLADEVREQADDLLGLQELAPPVELLSRICKQAHEWRIRLANVQLRLDVAEIADDPTADVWRRESSRVDALTAARDRLRALLREAVDIAREHAAHNNDDKDVRRLAAIAKEGLT